MATGRYAPHVSGKPTDILSGMYYVGLTPGPRQESFQSQPGCQFLDILGEINFSSSSPTEAIEKIEKLSKLVVVGKCFKKRHFFAKAIQENIPQGENGHDKHHGLARQRV